MNRGRRLQQLEEAGMTRAFLHAYTRRVQEAATEVQLPSAILQACWSDVCAQCQELPRDLPAVGERLTRAVLEALGRLPLPEADRRARHRDPTGVSLSLSHFA